MFDQYLTKSKVPSGRNISAGAFQPSVFLSLVLSFQAMSSSWSWEKQGQVGCLWGVLAEQTVDLFADASFPRSMGMSEIDRDPSILRQGFVLAHLAAPVKGHGASHMAFTATENRGKGLRYCVGLTIG